MAISPLASSSSSHPPIVELERVSRVFSDGSREVNALNGVSLAIAPGELVVVTGPSGSGKSTLLKLLGGLDSADSGRVIIDGNDMAGLGVSALARFRRQKVGYVFQDLNLVPVLTSLENVSLPLELDGISTSEALGQALSALESVGVGDLKNSYPDDISGGQQQRVAIARSLVGQRRLILADEPTGALDSESGASIMQLLRDRCNAGATAVVVTHDPRNAEWADRVVSLRDGVIVNDVDTRDRSDPA
jgi:putative ABC transport system ATP-binding protein